MNGPRQWRSVAVALLAIAAALLLDRWAWETLALREIYERDWGRLLRVTGSLALWFPLALAVWLEARARNPARAGRAWLLVGAPAASGLVSEVLKLLIRRERPGPHDGEWVFRPFTDRPFSTTDLGLPSGHTMVAVAGAAALARLFPRAAPVIWVLAAGSALSRVLAGAHFLSDVVTGAVAAVAVTALLWRRCLPRDRRGHSAL